ncbi:DUF4813 domain-containing protein [Hymenobacter sp. BT770]|uniref:DUF4813 domain-containing protein n=1 Tax=Hymenobacter sp. BT770 TaxID=2886942 RepID=UPI001D124B43|nr:DUF4813 domain-containing protein [Hymenobacter sp. BT770]MCC3152230.1 DUF4813 domain-containing protein [Hymenobacter sp. BT770]MDO3414044.1 DUF4813 domain-containing protein [Hymenobacter sp. BT770]
MVLLMVLAQLAHAETPAEANKRLFDKTIDELNFRTMETVYDKSFARGKFPITLRTAAARRSFDGFGNNAPLKQLFMNYNGIAERYKNRYGNGPNTLAEFEKQLKSVLLDKNFEFFIHNLPRDERVALVRAEQRLIQQATAQFNASGAPEEVAAVPPADVDAQPEAAMAAPLTTHEDAPTTSASNDEEPLSSQSAADAGAAPRHDWLDYFTLLLSLTSTLLLLYLITTVLPGLSRRVNNLSAEPEPEPETRSIASRLRPARSQGLREDRYEEDEDDFEPADPSRHDDD